MMMSSRGFRRIGDIVAKAAEILQPPERLRPSESIEKYVRLNNPGAYSGKYQNRTTPYMVEPLDEFVSPHFREEVFVGPAQSGKTESLVLGAVAHSIKTDPMDVLLYNPTNTAARDFSIRRVDRMHRNSPDIGDMLIKRKDADNKFDKQYVNGMLLTLSWPTPAELAGKPVPRVIFTDRDRMADDIEGDGEPFDLGAKRTTTFGRFAMCLAESSPSRPVKDPHWIRRGKHEAPPCEGILGLYNRGDRRRWYWPCPNCRSYFEGTFRHIVYEDRGSVLDTADTARLQCPHCDFKIHPDQRFEMNTNGRWLKEGQTIDEDGVISGTGARSNMASFWLNGAAAAFTTWPRLVQIYLDAMGEFERTGSEAALAKFYNNDLGEPYLPKSLETTRIPEHLMARAENWGGNPDEPVVPPGARFLVATIDVQKNMFIVQVHGIAPGMPFDVKVIDRFQIRKSSRIDTDGDVEWVKPGTYAEDWDEITTHVLKKTYALADDSGRRMMIKLAVCDSGGKDGVTGNAYAYWRRLRAEGMGARFHLVKGDHRPSMPRVQISWPDSSNRNTKAIARGDVPVMLFNSNQLKDELSNRLDSIVPGKGMVHFPKWLPDWFYTELCVEIRGERGWENPNKQRNESWDLLYYCLGACISPLIKVESLSWDKPPSWAEDWDTNTLVFKDSDPERFANRPSAKYDFSRFGQALA